MHGCQPVCAVYFFCKTDNSNFSDAMKRKFTRDISASMLQVIVIQCCGLIVFYLLSVGLSKDEFGEINWSLALLLTVFGVLSFGVDQIVVKRIASGDQPVSTLAVYLWHVVVSGLLFYLLLYLGSLIFPSFFKTHAVLLALGVGKLMIFFSTPFKQLATGLEKFRALLIMTTCSHLLRSVALLFLGLTGTLNISNVVIAFVLADIAELVTAVFIMQYRLKVPVTLKWNKGLYSGLLREAFPQFGVAIFSSVLARFDWIFLGLVAGNVIVANYSFAYKVFEVATLPMLVIAPLLIPRFTKIFHPAAGELTGIKSNDLFVLLRFEMIIASLAGLVLNVLWVPVIDGLTQGRYGDVNSNTILILSFAMPFLYFNNFLWTVNFAQGRLRAIFYVFLTSFLVNLAGNISLVPFWGADGAALAFLLAIIIQSLLYFLQTKLPGIRSRSFVVLLCPAMACAAGILAFLVFSQPVLVLCSALLLYFLLLFLTRQIGLADWHVFKRITGF